MAGLWQQPCYLGQGRVLALLHLICLLSPATGALPWDNTGGSSPLEVRRPHFHWWWGGAIEYELQGEVCNIDRACSDAKCK